MCYRKQVKNGIKSSRNSRLACAYNLFKKKHCLICTFLYFDPKSETLFQTIDSLLFSSFDSQSSSKILPL